MVPLAPSTSGRNVFCAQARHGYAFVYSALADYLPEGLGLVGLQDPIHAHVDVDFENFEQLVSVYADSIQRVQPAGPYDLLGWSYGGHIAFALGRELARRGETVSSLTIVDTNPVPPSNQLQSTGLHHIDVTDNANVVEHIDRHRDDLVEVAQKYGQGIEGDASLDPQLAGLAVAMMRCDEFMDQATHGYVDTKPLLISTRNADDAVLRLGEAVSAEAWSAHLPANDVLMVADEDHFSLMSPDQGLPKWGPQWTRFLEEHTSTNEES